MDIQLWTDSASLTLTQSSSPDADILVGFYTYDHKDGYPFDGPGGVLAHSFYPGPGIGGDLHIDDSEKWTINSYSGRWKTRQSG